MKKTIILMALPILLCLQIFATNQISSPDGKIAVTVFVDNTGVPRYSVTYNKTTVLEPSPLGIELDGINFSNGLQLTTVSATSTVHDHYNMLSGKKSSIQYEARKTSFTFQNKDGKKFTIIFQVSNDGLAFRYQFSDGPEIKIVRSESTSFKFPSSAKAFIQPIAVAQSGWEKANPSYEEHYYQDVPVGTTSKLGAGFVYPALFKVDNTWLLITEAAVGADWCATRLNCEAGSPLYQVKFPDPREVMYHDGLLPQQQMNGFSPWRIVTIGSLKTIVESTLGTDVATPSVITNTSFIKPGKSSWSWINSKDDFIVYDEQKKYIDFASYMHWQYCLIDVNWDQKIGYEKIKELADYARQKNVGLILWYNSAGDWNTVKYTPRNILLTKEAREKEFSTIQSMGIKGVKIDFFGGDGQSMIKYYHDILQDAARYNLMVNFHGATLPRGWARTYPNLLTAEAVRGFEYITFSQEDADLEANHATMLPFTRNVFDPMDFTPMNLYKIPSTSVRKTTAAFELATTIVFLSGIQHLAESPEGIEHVPDFAKNYLRTLPDTWDETRFIDGYPGKLVVIARRKGTKWFIAGMNGEPTAKTLPLNLSFLKKKKAILISDDDKNLLKQEKTTIPDNGMLSVSINANGGFVIAAE
ncbi:Glycosyl-hydrolase 97 C-terminal, oligomerisation [Chitinophaga ginsengisegetis]|uniref:Glycosyl-hydrolase 97 C-terminal, oligomerisation n=1 Tax=Chitinophaga ginsengisegetis TaxID=393003 RepID=A0A1T5NKT3_9BACT|nr:glycoside hydrolase family 97 protein [Chitinophaga ginsengisegetis]SKD00709.1 Glycosyl-hydrolase 97 C-terminal, oligomerisation [Chitinophaga ginsengisegetis]